MLCRLSLGTVMLTCCGQISVSICKLCSRLLIYNLGNNFEAWVLLVCLCICVFPDSSIQLFPFQSFCWICSIQVLVSMLLPISTDIYDLSLRNTLMKRPRLHRQPHSQTRQTGAQLAMCRRKFVPQNVWQRDKLSNVSKTDPNVRVGATEHTV